jgi:hypothetical protein
MGKKSRLKKRKGQGKFEENMAHLIGGKTRAFLNKRHVGMDRASRLSYIVAMMVNFLIYRSIKAHIQLPAVRPDDEKVDQDRMEAIQKRLASECERLWIKFHDIMDELVSPLAENEALFEPILRNIYTILDSFVSSKDFREAVEKQIEEPETWNDSLLHYTDRQEDYFEAVKKLFGLDLAVVRSGLDGESEGIDYEKSLEQIRKEYGIQPDDFEKLTRRATAFFRAIFATYLELDFQRVRDEVDTKILRPGL